MESAARAYAGSFTLADGNGRIAPALCRYGALAFYRDEKWKWK